MKRFYKMVSVEESPDGYAIHLEGKKIRTPSGAGLVAPNRELADLVAAEWAAQGMKIDPETMPLTQIVTTTQEHVRETRDEMTRLALAYLDTDLLCYRAPEPAVLAERQARHWDTWLVWFAQRFGSGLEITTALIALKQPQAAHEAVRDYVAALDLWRFSVLQMATSISGSIVLALAFTEKALTPQQVYDAMHVEEHYRSEIYNEAVHGADPQQEKVMAGKMRDLLALRQVLDVI
jgi:chaperone required for assembly of F1-ATPase